MFERIKEVMINTLHCDEEKIAPEAKLSDDLNIDSLDAVELTMALEEEFGIKIPDTELENLKTVQNLADCVNKFLQ